MSRIPVRGRPPKGGGAMVNRTFALPPAMLDRLDEMAKESTAGLAAPDFLRQALAQFLDGPQHVNVEDDEAFDSTRLKFLAVAPAGDWDEAIRAAGDFVLSRQVADELAVRPGDVVVRVNGDSMTGLGIFDRALLVMREIPNNKPPRKGTTTLVQITRGKDESALQYESTIKTWMSESDLRDGNDTPFKLPADTRKVTPIAEAVGIISSL